MGSSECCRLCHLNDLPLINVLETPLTPLINQLVGINIETGSKKSNNICVSCQKVLTDFVIFRSECLARELSLIEEDDTSYNDHNCSEIEKNDDSQKSDLSIPMIEINDNDKVTTKTSAKNTVQSRKNKKSANNLYFRKRHSMFAIDDIEKYLERGFANREEEDYFMQLINQGRDMEIFYSIYGKFSTIRSGGNRTYGERTWFCPSCEPKRYLGNWLDFVDHINSKHKVFPLEVNCSLCGYVVKRKPKDIDTFAVYYRFKYHTLEHLRDHICDTCDLNFKNENNLNNHRIKEHTGFYTCKESDCNLVFYNYQKFQYHIRKTHKDETCICVDCGKVCNTKSRLNQHIKVVHKQDKKITCQYCGRLFSKNWNLKVHLATHGYPAVPRKRVNSTDPKKVDIENK